MKKYMTFYSWGFNSTPRGRLTATNRTGILDCGSNSRYAVSIPVETIIKMGKRLEKQQNPNRAQQLMNKWNPILRYNEKGYRIK